MIVCLIRKQTWAKFLLLAALVGVGLAGGLYLATANVALETQSAARFPLTAADAKDTLEAPVATFDDSGRLYVAWASRTGDDERTLFLIRSDDAGKSFDAPRIIARSGVHKAVSTMKGKIMTRELRMVPHLAASKLGVHLAWTEALPGNAGVRMVAALSTDRGDSFGEPTAVAQGERSRPTFTALAVRSDGSLLSSWLDNRDKAQQCYAALRRPGQIEFDREQIVHAGDDAKGVCPCCPTAALLGADGTAYVAFRNVADGFRDIAIGVMKPGEAAYTRWNVVTPTWRFSGCPHDGPSLALVGETLHVVWMDGHSGSPRCYHASAKIADMIFAVRELHPLAAGTQGNAKLFVDARGILHAVWEESLGVEAAPGEAHRHEPPVPTPGIGGGRVVMHRVLHPNASQFGPASPIAARSGAFPMRPFVTGSANGDIIVGWNELDETGKSVVVRRLSLGEGTR
jgi:hypothetical protein